MRAMGLKTSSGAPNTLRPAFYATPLMSSRRRENAGARRRDARSQGLTVSAFFNFFGGGSKKKEAEPADYVEDSALPFPKSLLNSTFLKGRKLALAYQASRDGFGAAAFHKRVDFKGPVLVFCISQDGRQWGGFNPVGFESTDDYRSALNAFLFFVPKGGKAAEPVILKKVGGGEAAVFDYRKGGPQWGADGLLIGAPTSPVFGGFAGPDSETGGFGELRTAKSRLGLSYASIPKEFGETSIFGGSKTDTKIKDVLVYYAPELASLY